LESPATLPLFKSVAERPFTLNPILSPGIAYVRDTWCISTDFTYDLAPVGAKVMDIPDFIIPVSTLPVATVPILLILYTS
jgi:hypothetical protein